MPSIAFIHGFSEGPSKSRTLRAFLRTHGFVDGAAVQDADIIVTHSGGCALLPAHYRAKLIIMIAPTVGPATRTPIRTQLRKMRLDQQNLGWLQLLRHTIPNVRNLFLHPRRNWRMWSRIRAGQGTLPITKVPTIVMVCEGDPWSASMQWANLPKHYNGLTVRRDHDDIWYNSKPYATLLALLAKK